MRTRVLFILLTVMVLSLMAGATMSGASNGSEYNISISGSLDVPDRTVNIDGNSFTISRVKAIDPGDRFTASLDVPSEDTEYSVQVRDTDKNIYDTRRLQGDDSVTFDAGDLGLGPGAYFVALRNDTFRNIYRVIVEGYDVQVNDIPDTTDATITVNATATEKSSNSQSFTGLDLVVWNDTVSRNINLSASSGEISTTVPLSGLSPGTYSAYVVARGNETVSGQKVPIGFSNTYSLQITSNTSSSAGAGPNVSSSEAVGLASDIRGPIEYRGESQYQVVVAFDRHLNDIENVTFRVRGKNLLGSPLDINRSATSGNVTLSDGVASDGGSIENSVARIDIGEASNEGNDLVTDGRLEVWYDGSLINTFDIIETSSRIDAGNPDSIVYVYGGERVAVYNLTGQHDAYEVFESDGNFWLSGQSGDNTTVAFEDTDPAEGDFVAGETYDFEFVDKDAITRDVNGSTEVEIRDLGIGIKLNRSDESTEGVNLTVTVSSNVANRFIQLDLLKDGSPIDSITVGLRGGGADREETVTFTNLSVSGDSEYTVRATDLETGIQRVEEVSSHTCIGDAVSGSDDLISLSEIQKAINWWAENEPVPNTGGQTISLTQIQNLINTWAEVHAVSC